MTQRFVVYEESTGRIRRTGSAPPGQIPAQAFNPGEVAVATNADLRDDLHYRDLETGGWRERPPLPVVLDKDTIIADGADEAVLSGLPEGAEVAVRCPERGDFVADERGVFRLLARVPGQYRLRVQSFPYRDAAYTVTAAAPVPPELAALADTDPQEVAEQIERELAGESAEVRRWVTRAVLAGMIALEQRRR